MDKEEVKELIEVALIKIDNARRSDDWVEYRRILEQYTLRILSLNVKNADRSP